MKQSKKAPGDAATPPACDEQKRAPGLRKLDYLSFTLKEYTSPLSVIDAIGIELVPLPYGRFGYQRMSVAPEGGISVMWDAVLEGMGVHVQISGKGCNLIEHQETFDSWQAWIGRWFAKGAKVGRIDLAIDDVSGAIEFETVYNQVRSRTALMRTKKGGHRVQWDAKDEYQTLYVGERKSETMLRVYDKGLQLGGETSWLRFVFEYKKRRADAIARLLVEEGWDAAIGAGRAFIEFKGPGHITSDRSRQRPADWWVDLMAASKHFVRLERDQETSLMKSYLWLRSQGGPVIAALLEHEGGDLGWVVDLAKDGKSRWKERHRRMLREGME